MSMPPTKGETRGSWRMQPPGTLPGISNQLAPRDVSKPGLANRDPSNRHPFCPLPDLPIRQIDFEPIRQIGPLPDLRL